MDDVNERIRNQIKINRSLGLKGDNWKNYAVALIGTQHDASGAEDGLTLSDATRDTLIRHNRQDTAHALGNTTSILDRVRELTRLVYVLLVLVIGLGVAVAYLMIKQAALLSRLPT
jgi:hypothetical protein